VPLLDVDDCVLVVIDAQPGFYAEPDPRAQQALARVVWLVLLAGRLGVPVVVTEEDAAKNGPTDQTIAAALPAGASVLDKPTFALTGAPAILEAVRLPGRGTVVLVGFETDICVAHSAVGLVDEGLRVVVVEDAVHSPGEMHARGLARALAGGAELNHAKGVGYEWVRTVEASRRVIDADPQLNPAPFPL
jgi:nicotinamidase-related amidase